MEQETERASGNDWKGSHSASTEWRWVLLQKTTAKEPRVSKTFSESTTLPTNPSRQCAEHSCCFRMKNGTQFYKKQKQFLPSSASRSDHCLLPFFSSVSSPIPWSCSTIMQNSGGMTLHKIYQKQLKISSRSWFWKTYKRNKKLILQTSPSLHHQNNLYSGY